MYSQTRQPAYAPTPYSYTPASNLGATISLDEEVKLPTNASERDLLESLAEIYSIIVTLEGLEKAFNKDSVTDAEYTELCNRLLRQYKSNLSDARIAHQFGDIDAFRAKWGMECPRATERLKVGLPATSTHATAGMPMPGTGHGTAAPAPSQGGIGGASAQSAILATENFITFLDALKLGMASKDQLHPLLSEVIQSVNKVTDTDFEGRGNVIKWLIHLNGMKAHEELSEDDQREIEFQMEGAYRGFKAVMQ